MAQTLLLVGSDIHWVIVEDAPSTSDWVRQLAERTLPGQHTLLHCQRNETKDGQPYTEQRDRLGLPTTHPGSEGAIQRNCALDWIIENEVKEGVIYFANEDNSYDRKLFDEVRWCTFTLVCILLNFNLYNAEISCDKPWRPKGFFIFKSLFVS